MKRMEIERRFLLFPCKIESFLKKSSLSYKSLYVFQFYLEREGGEVLRYRQIGKEFIKTVKKGEGISRKEIEEKIGKEEFLRALLKKEGRVIKKIRYVVEFENKKFEFDAFLGFLKGLNILEIEFFSINEAKNFSLPKIFAPLIIEEVTEIREFSNKALSKSFYPPSFKTDLSSFFSNFQPSFKASLKILAHPYSSLIDLIKMAIFSLAQTVEKNKDAILKGDLDIERLHQLRVALRKIRTIFKTLDFSFNREFFEWQKENLAVLMKYTNEIRDIDVFLIHLEKYKEILPLKLKSSLDPLCDTLNKEREKRYLDLKALLESELFSEVFKFLKCLCKSDFKDIFQKEAQIPVILVSKKVLFKKFDKFLKKAKKIETNSSAKEYHRLRIKIKEIRYLNEFFSAVFDKDKYQKIGDLTKNIQNILGEHQDFEVQKDKLKNLLNKEISKDTKKAVKFLIKFIEKEIGKRRKYFKKELGKFKKSKKILHQMICGY